MKNNKLFLLGTLFTSLLLSGCAGGQLDHESDNIEVNDAPNGKYIDINSVQDFINIDNNPNANYRLQKDLDFKDATNYSGVKKLNGHFDGNGHTIKNITINKKASDVSALFKEVGTKDKKGMIYIGDFTLSNINLSCTQEFVNVDMGDGIEIEELQGGNLSLISDTCYQAMTFNNIKFENINLTGHEIKYSSLTNMAYDTCYINNVDLKLKHTGNIEAFNGLVGTVFKYKEHTRYHEVTIKNSKLDIYLEEAHTVNGFINTSKIKECSNLKLTLKGNRIQSIAGLASQNYNYVMPFNRGFTEDEAFFNQDIKPGDTLVKNVFMDINVKQLNYIAVLFAATDCMNEDISNVGAIITTGIPSGLSFLNHAGGTLNMDKCYVHLQNGGEDYSYFGPFNGYFVLFDPLQKRLRQPAGDKYKIVTYPMSMTNCVFDVKANNYSKQELLVATHEGNWIDMNYIDAPQVPNLDITVSKSYYVESDNPCKRGEAIKENTFNSTFAKDNLGFDSSIWNLSGNYPTM